MENVQNVLLVILLLLALALIAVVLLQRSEGGGLGIGGGGGGGVMSARGAATALGKITWGLGFAFLATALMMTVLSARQSADSSVIDRTEAEAVQPEAPAAPDAGGLTAVPSTTEEAPTDAPLAPPRAD